MSLADEQLTLTPGPWHASRKRRYVNDMYNSVVAEVVTRKAGDALLLAAAPQMLAALKEAALQLEYLAEKFGETGTGNAVIARTRAAIDRAEGRGF